MLETGAVLTSTGRALKSTVGGSAGRDWPLAMEEDLSSEKRRVGDRLRDGLFFLPLEVGRFQ